MTTSIISSNEITTLKLIFNENEKTEITQDTEIDFFHTDNIKIIDSNLFKQQILKLINNIEILKKK